MEISGRFSDATSVGRPSPLPTIRAVGSTSCISPYADAPLFASGWKSDSSRMIAQTSAAGIPLACAAVSTSAA